MVRSLGTRISRYRFPVVETAAPAVETAAPAKRRDPWFDNAKMTLIVLVVVGHSWTLLPHNAWDDWTYDFLYSWHIPAFVIVTGYLSRSFEWTRARMWSLVTTVAVPYVVFEGLLVWFRHEFGGVDFKLIWANPHWPMWYLSALFFWRLMTPLFKRLPAKVVVAVVISLAAGIWATDIFDNARIFGLLPFFVLGLKMHEGHWALLRTRRARWWGFGVLGVMFVVARFAGGWFSTEWFYYRSRYDTLDSTDTQAFVIRLCLLLTGMAGAFAFFTVVPRTKTWFTALGSATIVVYLFHGFFVLSAEFLGYKDWTADHVAVAFVLTTLAAVGLALLLAWKPVSSRLNTVVDPIGSFTRWRRARAG
jgi:fucose 4-O-acetylase-like acetyltransferase